MKTIPIVIVAVAILIAGIIILSGGSSPAQAPDAAIETVSVQDGTQLIDITVKGGYSPRRTVARADMPTILRMKTNGTFDCSSALAIPSLNYQNNLPPSGVTEIEVPPQKAGTTLQGRCSMGMYHFEVAFN